MTTIKAIYTNYYEIELFRTENMLFYIQYRVNGIVKESELINDYKTVDLLFEMKQVELSGH